MNELEIIVDAIRAEVSPDQILLFGSRARGDFDSESDYDVLVVVSNVYSDKNLSGRIYRQFFRRKLKTPVDVLVVNTEKYNKLSDDIGYVYKTIKEEGHVVYENV